MRGRKPGLYVTAALPLAAAAARLDSSWIPGALAGATAIALAAANLERAGRPRSSMWTEVMSIAGVATIIASLMDKTLPALPVAGLLALSAGLVFADRTRVRGRTVVACAAAAAVAAGIAEYFWIGGRYGYNAEAVLDLLLLAILGAIGGALCRQESVSFRAKRPPA